MKKSLIIIFFLISQLSLAAPTLRCEPAYMEDHGIGGIALFAYDMASFECETKDRSENYQISMMGIGPGLRMEGSGGEYRLVCPLVRKKKLAGIYLGAKVSAGFFAGGDVAVLTNKTLGVCLLYGVSLEQIGASVSIDYIKIEKISVLNEYLAQAMTKNLKIPKEEL